MGMRSMNSNQKAEVEGQVSSNITFESWEVTENGPPGASNILLGG